MGFNYLLIGLFLYPTPGSCYDASAKSVGVVISAISLGALFANMIINFSKK